MQFLDNCTGVDSGHVSSSHFFLSVIPNVHLIKMCIKQLFFGGVVADVGVIAITVIYSGWDYSGHKKCTKLYSTIQILHIHDCGFTSIEAKSQGLYSVWLCTK